MSTARSGFTLIEAMVAFTMLTIVMGAGILAMRPGQRSFQQTMSAGVANTHASRAINRVARELVGARGRTLAISPNLDSVTFESVAGWAGGAATWSADSRIGLELEAGELDNGIDDDGDGFVDEQQIVMTERLDQPDERRVVLVRSVREFLEGEEPDGVDNNGNLLDDERGLVFESLGDALMIRLTLQRRQPEGGVTFRTLSTIVGVRN